MVEEVAVNESVDVDVEEVAEDETVLVELVGVIVSCR